MIPEMGGAVSGIIHPRSRKAVLVPEAALK